MKGLEGMILNLLRGMGFDPDVVKAEVIGKTEMIENNIKMLNSNLSIIAERLNSIEQKLGIENGRDNIHQLTETNMGVGKTLEGNATEIG